MNASDLGWVGPLPHRENAVVPRAKLGYFLDEAWRRHPCNKVGLIRDQLGFFDPDELRTALVAHAQSHAAFHVRDNGYGDVYAVVGAIVGPTGVRFERFISGWFVGYGSTMPTCSTVMVAKRGRQ